MRKKTRKKRNKRRRRIEETHCYSLQINYIYRNLSYLSESENSLQASFQVHCAPFFRPKKGARFGAHTIKKGPPLSAGTHYCSVSGQHCSVDNNINCISYRMNNFL